MHYQSLLYKGVRLCELSHRLLGLVGYSVNINQLVTNKKYKIKTMHQNKN